MRLIGYPASLRQQGLSILPLRRHLHRDCSIRNSICSTQACRIGILLLRQVWLLLCSTRRHSKLRLKRRRRLDLQEWLERVVAGTSQEVLPLLILRLLRLRTLRRASRSLPVRLFPDSKRKSQLKARRERRLQLRTVVRGVSAIAPFLLLLLCKNLRLARVRLELLGARMERIRIVLLDRLTRILLGRPLRRKLLGGPRRSLHSSNSNSSRPHTRAILLILAHTGNLPPILLEASPHKSSRPSQAVSRICRRMLSA